MSEHGKKTHKHCGACGRPTRHDSGACVVCTISGDEDCKDMCANCGRPKGEKYGCEMCGPPFSRLGPMASPDMVHSPPHYTSRKMECIDVLEAILTPDEFRGFCLGNAIKYRWRAGLKGDAAQDMEKADWYTERMTRGGE